MSRLFLECVAVALLLAVADFAAIAVVVVAWHKIREVGR